MSGRDVRSPPPRPRIIEAGRIRAASIDGAIADSTDSTTPTATPSAITPGVSAIASGREVTYSEFTVRPISDRIPSASTLPRAIPRTEPIAPKRRPS